jgi:hypothetical protein
MGRDVVDGTGVAARKGCSPLPHGKDAVRTERDVVDGTGVVRTERMQSSRKGCSPHGTDVDASPHVKDAVLTERK